MKRANISTASQPLTDSEEKSAYSRSVSRYSIIQLLKGLSDKEVAEFRRLVDSSFFNNNSKLSVLLSELVKHHPEYPAETISPEKAFAAANGKKKYDDVLFRKYMSELFKLGEDFLCILEYRRDVHNKSLNILSQMFERGMDSLFIKKARKLEAEILGSGYLEHTRYLYLHSLYRLLHDNKIVHAESITDLSELQSSHDCLLNYFLFYNNSLAEQKKSLSSFITGNEDLHLSDDFSKIADIRKYLSDAIEQDSFKAESDRLYFGLLLLDRELSVPEKEAETFIIMKDAVTGKKYNMSEGMYYYYIHRLISYCLIKVLNGNKEFKRHVYELYKFAIDNGYLRLEGNWGMRIKEFRNIVTLAVMNNDIEWAEELTHKYISTKKGRQRENILNFGLAFISFHKMQYEKTLHLIDKLDYNSHEFVSEFYMLKIQAFYELGFPDSSMAVLDSYRHHLGSSELYSDNFREANLAFVRLVRRLISLKKNPGAAKLSRLQEDIENCKLLPRRSWIIDKVNEHGYGRKN